MPGLDVLYKQTVTIFNRVKNLSGEDVLWYPTIIKGVHLIIDRAAVWDMQGGRASDNARLHIRYAPKNGKVFVGDKEWLEPKEWRKKPDRETAITFGYGNDDDFDFFIAGAFDSQLFATPISDALFERRGFYNYMNANYDNVFAITGVSKKNLIPHFEITGR